MNYEILIPFVFAVIGWFWRPWLGGSYWRVSRFVKLSVLFLLCCAIFAWQLKGLTGWELALGIAIDLWDFFWFMRFWNHTHGDYFGVNDTRKDEARCTWVDKMLRVIFGTDGYYNFWGNVTGLLLGYSVPAILCSVAQSKCYFMFGGLIVAFVYGFFGKMFPNTGTTKRAEYVCGAVCFALWAYCQL